MKTQQERLTKLQDDKIVFFEFMRERYPVFYNSNIFLRDIQYAIRTYFERKDIRISYVDAEELAFEFTEKLENEKMLVRMDYMTWKVNFKFDEPVAEEEEAATA